MRVKICGLSTAETLDAALDAGADMIGLVFHPRSPRLVTREQAAALAAQARERRGAETVVLLVDPDDEQVDAVMRAVRPDWLQLHGRERPERVAALRARSGARVMKALGVAAAADLAHAAAFAAVADVLLLDAKPPADAAYPGGHGAPFDWTVLATLDPATPFMLSGGLTAETVAAALGAARGLSCVGVDVSSGVESAPGVKDPARIAAFVAAARGAAQEQDRA